jgi:hypothetical protein
MAELRLPSKPESKVSTAETGETRFNAARTAAAFNMSCRDVF